MKKKVNLVINSQIRTGKIAAYKGAKRTILRHHQKRTHNICKERNDIINYKPVHIKHTLKTWSEIIILFHDFVVILMQKFQNVYPHLISWCINWMASVPKRQICITTSTVITSQWVYSGKDYYTSKQQLT